MKKIGWVDGLKAIICWFVFFEHFETAFGYVPGIRNLPKNYFGFLTCGNLALNIFFVLTAFLATHSVFCTDKCDVRWVASKALGRYLRLSLPLFVLNLVTYIMEKSEILNMNLAEEIGAGYISTWYIEKHSFKDVLISSFIRGMFTEDVSFNLSTWMMVYLLLGYFVAFAIALLIKRSNVFIRLIVTASLALFLFFCESQFCVFAFGCFDYVVYEELRNRKMHIIWRVVGYILVVGALLVSNRSKGLVYLFSDKRLFGAFTSWWHFSWLAAPAIVIGVCLTRLFAQLLSTKFFQSASKIALPMFLFHELCIATIGLRLVVWLCDSDLTSALAMKIAFAGSIVASLVVCVIYSLVFEPNINRLTKVLISPLSRRK